MSEVSCRNFGPIFDALDSHRIPREALVEGLPVSLETLSKSRNRIEWDVFALICERLEVLFGRDRDLEFITYDYIHHTNFVMMRKLVSILATPRDIYYIGLWFGRNLYGVLEDSLVSLPDGRLQQELRLPAIYRDSPQFFKMMRGAMRRAPSMLGAPDATVDMELHSRRAVYLISPPPSPARIRLRRFFVSPFVTRDMITELTAQQAEATATQSELFGINLLGRQLSKSIELADVVDALLNLTLSSFRCEGIELWLAPVERGPVELLESRGRCVGPSKQSIDLQSGESTFGRLEVWWSEAELNGNQPDLLREFSSWASVAVDNARRQTFLNVRLDLLSERLAECEAELDEADRRVESVLEFASAPTGDAREISAEELARDSLRGCLDYARSRKVELARDGAAGTALLHAAAPQLQTALSQLIRNAVDAAAEGDRRVVLTLSESEEWLRFAVSDGGSGVPEEDRARIFEPFYSTRIAQGHRGLGLTIARRIAEQLAGRIEVGADSEGRTRVVLCLPIGGDD